MLCPTQRFIPLLGLPIPPLLDRTLGYVGNARYVAFYWYLKNFHWADGRHWMKGAEWRAWRLYTQHPRIAPYFGPFTLYDEKGEVQDWFVLDRETQSGYIGAMYAARACLQSQYAPAPAIMPLEFDDADWSRLVEQLSQTVSGLAPEEIVSHRKRQTDRELSLLRWLNHL